MSLDVAIARFILITVLGEWFVFSSLRLIITGAVLCLVVVQLDQAFQLWVCV